MSRGERHREQVRVVRRWERVVDMGEVSLGEEGMVRVSEFEFESPAAAAAATPAAESAVVDDGPPAMVQVLETRSER